MSFPLSLMLWLYLHYFVIGTSFVVVVVVVVGGGGGGGGGDGGSGSVYGGTRFIYKDRNTLNNLNVGSLEEEEVLHGYGYKHRIPLSSFSHVFVHSE